MTPDFFELIHSIAANFIEEYSTRVLSTLAAKEKINPSFLFADDLALTTRCAFTNELLLAVFLGSSPKLTDPDIIDKKVGQNGTTRVWTSHIPFIETVDKHRIALENNISDNKLFVYSFDLQFGFYDGDAHVVTVIQYFDDNAKEVRYNLYQSYILCYSLMNYMNSAKKNEIKICFNHDEFSKFLDWIEKIQDTNEWTKEVEENYFKYFFVSKNLIGHHFKQGFIIDMEYGEATVKDTPLMNKKKLKPNPTQSLLIRYNYKCEHKDLFYKHFSMNQKSVDSRSCLILANSTFSLYELSINDINNFIEAIKKESDQLKELPWHTRNLSKSYEPVEIVYSPPEKKKEIKQKAPPSTLFTIPAPKKEEKDPLDELKQNATSAYYTLYGATIAVPNEKIPDLANNHKLDKYFNTIQEYMQACVKHNRRQRFFDQIIENFNKWELPLSRVGVTEDFKLLNEEQTHQGLHF